MIHQHFVAVLVPIIAALLIFPPLAAHAQSRRSSNPQDWEKVLEAAKKEGRVRLSIPASAELRKQLGQATRWLDVDTKWLTEGGVIAAKDQLSVKDFLRIENQSEEKLEKVREPALKVAQALLQ
jgi:hypothetical protein